MTRTHLRLRARRGKRDELRRELDRLEVLVVIREQPGLLGVEVLASEDDPDDLLVAASWASRAHYERWRGSEEPDRLLRDLRRLLAAEPEASVYGLIDAAA